MESVDAIAQKLIPCTCGGYGENNRRHMSDCPRFRVAWEAIAAALTAERAKFAAFADEKGEPHEVIVSYIDRTNGPNDGCTFFICKTPAATSALAAAKEQK